MKVIKALYAHFKSEGDSLPVSEKNLVYSIDKTYQLYLLLLSMAIDLVHHAEKRIEAGKKKMLPTREDLNPNMKLVENRAIAKLAGGDELLTRLASEKLSWANYPELIRKVYANLLTRDYFTEYMENGKSSFRDDLNFLIEFYTRELEDMEELEQVVEEQSIYWADDIGFALIMVVRTLQGMRESDPEVRLLPKYKNEEDHRFTLELFRKALLNHADYFDRIDKAAENWDLERIAYMDRLIMLATITELVSCPTIPVKVTLDEYIEIAKYYSTHASGTFINGVLDKLVDSLTKEGKICKEGRGLME